MNDLIRRRDATQATKNAYNGVPFAWSHNCVHMLRDHLVNMGHDVPDVPDMETMTDAVRALKANGWNNVTEMLDEILDPIAPARMMMGDVAVLPGQGGLEAIFICAGPLKLFGWREDEETLVLLDIGLDQFAKAWRA